MEKDKEDAETWEKMRYIKLDVVSHVRAGECTEVRHKKAELVGQ